MKILNSNTVESRLIGALIVPISAINEDPEKHTMKSRLIRALIERSSKINEGRDQLNTHALTDQLVWLIGV